MGRRALSAAEDFYAELGGRGVRLVAAPGGKLRVKGNLGQPDDLARLKKHKQGLLKLLSSDSSKPSSPSSPEGDNPHKTAALVGDDGGDEAKTSSSPSSPKGEPRFLADFREAASDLGLVAAWSRHHGYVSVHDPTTGEWHDLRTKDAPDWAVGEARRRKPGLARKGGGG
jgi:hypothetical protein